MFVSLNKIHIKHLFTHPLQKQILSEQQFPPDIPHLVTAASASPLTLKWTLEIEEE